MPQYRPFTALTCTLLVTLLFGSAPAGDSADNRSDETVILAANQRLVSERKLQLLPIPKRLSFPGAPIPLTGPKARQFMIVLARETERGRIAVNEIISRIHEFAPRMEIPVTTAVQAEAYNIIIENKWPNTFTADHQCPAAARATDQAYGIYPAGDRILLAGRGEIGMLYAAVTLRWLIQDQNGQLLLHPARVIDWPDFKFRQLSHLTAPYHKRFRLDDPRKYLAHMKQYVDRLFRIKVNSVHTHTILTQHFESLPDRLPSRNAPYAAARLLNQYLLARGISTIVSGDVAVGYFPRDRARFEKTDLLFRRGHRKYYSWARHDLLRNKAENMGRFCHKAGFRQMFVHAVDGGGLRDPECWSRRSKLDREVYGNDRVRADADMFNIFGKMLRQHGVEPVFVVYPYSAKHLQVTDGLKSLGMSDTPGNRLEVGRLISSVKNWMRELNQKLMPGIRICVREDSRARLKQYRDNFPGRPFWVYWEVQRPPGRCIHPILPSPVRCVRSAFRPECQDDILYMSMLPKLAEPAITGAAEYAWNTAFPGSGDLDREYLDHGQLLVDDPQAYAVLAERAAIGLWGYRMGMILEDFLAAHASLRFAVAPKEVLKVLDIRNLQPLLEANHLALLRSEKALDRAWLELKSRREHGWHPGMSQYAHAVFICFRRMVKAAVPYAGVQLQLERAFRHACRGRPEKASTAIRIGRELLARGRASWESAMQQMKDEPWVMRYKELSRWDRGHPETRLLAPDFDSLARMLDELAAKAPLLYRQYNVPGWFKSFMGPRPLTVMRTRQPVIIDGNISEPAWQQAVPIRHFVAHKALAIAPRPVEARMLFDAEYLYLGAKIDQNLIARIHEPQRNRKEYAFTESVEWLLAPDKHKPEIFQFVVDSTGNLFTLHELIPKNAPAGKEVGWEGHTRVAVKRSQHGWSLEIAVSLAALGKRADNQWASLVTYNRIESLTPRKVETYACRYCNGGSYHDISLHRPLRFHAHPPATHAIRPLITCDNISMRERTHADGSGTLVTFDLRIETRTPMRHAKAGAVFLDRNQKPVGRVDIFKLDYLPLVWASTTPIRTQLETSHQGLWLKIRVDYRIDQTSDNGMVVEKLFPLGDLKYLLRKNDIYGPGNTPDSMGLNLPVYLDVNTPAGKMLSFNGGVIALRLRPRTLVSLDNQCIFYYGPHRPRHPAHTNFHSISLVRMAKGYLVFRVSSENYQTRSVSCRIREWRPEQWHDLICAWNLNAGGKTRMAIYIDGKRASNEVRDWHKINNTGLMVAPATYALQVGCFASGCGAIDANIDELLISPCALPADAFASTPNPENLKNLLRFSFEGSLTGIYDINGEHGTVTAMAGHQGNR